MARRNRLTTAPRAEPGPTRQTRASAHEYTTRMCGQTLSSPARVSEPDNLVLEHLKKIQGALSAARERDEALLARMATLEMAMLSVKREVLLGEETDARLQVAVDGILRRVGRIERRLDLAD